MRSPVFGNEIFDQWLNQKTNEILSKVERERISTEDMLILSLKAQVNHFHHMDIEFRDEFREVRKEIKEVKKEMDQRFEQVDKRFERMTTLMLWGFGLTLSLLLAMALKSYL